MAIDNFIPEVWSDRLKIHLDKALVYGMVVNREYQSDLISYGDTVNINRVENLTIGDYTKNGTITAPETLTGAQVKLIIDQAKYFNFEIDDIDKAQQKPKVMDAAMRRAAYGLGDAKDQYIAALYTGVAAANIVGLGDDTTPVVPIATDIYNYFTQAGMLLTEANVPTNDRWAVIPAWMHKLLQDSGEFTADTAMGDDVKINGYIGMVAGFKVYVSNNVPNTTGTKYKVMFGTSEAITFADQINSVEAYRPEGSFSDAVKGLDVYGAKLVHDDGIAVMTANKA
jgi:hypothetical protein